MNEVFEAIWFCERLSSSEHFRYTWDGGQRRFIGVTVLPRWDRPVTMRYELLADEHWNTRSAIVRVDHHGPELRIEVDPTERTWVVDGGLAPQFQGCTDLDLGWTPATNTLPINRLRLQVGEASSVRAAWLRFPELDLVVADQTYERADADRWIYRSGDFSADLVTDEHGFVTRYGDDLWRMVASSS